jgi:hypothetical protein
MSKTYKHQSTYNYIHDNGTVKGRLLRGVKSYFNRLNFSRWDCSRISWFKHKNRKENCNVD